mmetsp:Transcript_10890/g.16059  ORF Transcript_10890/g.16059 Transcript_10890/m.16059 type:complete len:248 (-) Transcript_10890:62-805(-)
MNLRRLSFFFLLECFQPIDALAQAARAAAALKDYSSVANGLFGNMRTPAALIGGSLVPLGMLGNPPIRDDDSKRMKILKKANFLLSLASLLNQVIAVVYSSVAINKLAEISQPATATVSDLISQNHELAWLGTNIHFLLGLMGFGLVVGTRAFFLFGGSVGKIGLCWGVAFFLQAASIVNRGIAQGSGETGSASMRYASNLFTLILKYQTLVFKNATSGVCSMAAVLVSAYSAFLAIKFFVKGDEED